MKDQKSLFKVAWRSHSTTTFSRSVYVVAKTHAEAVVTVTDHFELREEKVPYEMITELIAAEGPQDNVLLFPKTTEDKISAFTKWCSELEKRREADKEDPRFEPGLHPNFQPTSIPEKEIFGMKTTDSSKEPRQTQTGDSPDGLRITYISWDA